MKIDCYISQGCGSEEALKENIARAQGKMYQLHEALKNRKNIFEFFWNKQTAIRGGQG